MQMLIPEQCEGYIYAFFFLFNEKNKTRTFIVVTTPCNKYKLVRWTCNRLWAGIQPKCAIQFNNNSSTNLSTRDTSLQMTTMMTHLTTTTSQSSIMSIIWPKHTNSTAT